MHFRLFAFGSWVPFFIRSHRVRFIFCILFCFLFLRNVPFVCNLHMKFLLAVAKYVETLFMLRIFVWLCQFHLRCYDRLVCVCTVVFFDWALRHQFWWLRWNYTKLKYTASAVQHYTLSKVKNLFTIQEWKRVRARRHCARDDQYLFSIYTCISGISFLLICKCNLNR